LPKNKSSKNNKFIIGSLYQWTLASFIIAILPLVFAILFTLREVAEYTEKSQQTLFQTVNSTENSRIILERLISMERSIRQFQVLREPEFLISYKEHRNQFLDTLKSLKTKEQDKNLIVKLNILSKDEGDLYRDILIKSKRNQDSTNEQLLTDNSFKLEKSDLNVFDQLTAQARTLISEGEKKLGTEAATLSVIGQRVRERLRNTTLGSIPFALSLCLLFVYLLTRPIKKIAKSIRNLGEVGFDQPIVIKGPKDLIELGRHLEWLRHKLNRLEFEKQQFIRNVSHELKTPLATLKEGTDLLSENVVGELNTEQQEIIELMKLGNITIHDLIENLLEYQRSISTKVELNVSNFELKSLLWRIINEYQLPLRSKGITLKSNLSHINININADYDKLRIIVSNLFSNALKFSPHNATIAITLYKRNDFIELIIEDQGIGIDKENQSLIFEEFYRGDSPQAWKIKSTGLGLALVKHYLKIHKGSIRLLPPNKQYCGARFSLLLPQNLDI
jgi:two-component system sensor histidine kinase GlrK